MFFLFYDSCSVMNRHLRRNVLYSYVLKNKKVSCYTVFCRSVKVGDYFIYSPIHTFTLLLLHVSQLTLGFNYAQSDLRVTIYLNTSIDSAQKKNQATIMSSIRFRSDDSLNIRTKVLGDKLYGRR